MPEVIWLPQALRDVDRLYRFLLEKNPQAAQLAAETILQGCQQSMPSIQGSGDPCRNDEFFLNLMAVTRSVGTIKMKLISGTCRAE